MAKKKEHKHDFRLYSVAGQRVIACSKCGKRQTGIGVVDLKLAREIKDPETLKKKK